MSKRIPLIRFPKRGAAFAPQPNLSVPPSAEAAVKAASHDTAAAGSIPPVPSSAAIVDTPSPTLSFLTKSKPNPNAPGAASLQPKRMPVTDEEIELIMMGGAVV
eukprot:TRINITY_DN36934_c0_g1_i1.p2 TRINITY_DN36934_c0_g1~~TRINITY_DN36934_c0_g1_i1.p2  ORF type:complete len:104 (+),score=15.40 TRINITY_DN36934_c0_g1_i1:88-399(+)